MRLLAESLRIPEGSIMDHNQHNKKTCDRIEASRRMVRNYDFVITSGGIGPTHDGEILFFSFIFDG